MTKPVTSVALMQLIEQGRLGLDDPAEKYLPELAGLKVFESFDAATGAYQLRPASRPPTVKHFLTHTSGLAYPFTSAIWRDFKPRAGETYPFGGPLLFDPGERWHYSTSTDVVGKLVEVVSGQKLEDYFRQHIFAPLKMDDTSYNVPEAKGPRLVAQQQRGGERMDGAIELQKPQLGLTIAAPIGGGGLASTAERLRALRAHAAQRRRARRRACAQGRDGGADGPEPHRRGLGAGAQERAAAQRRLHLHRGRPRQMGARLPDHGRSGARQALARQPELGRHQQHVLLDRSARGIAGVIMMQYLPFADAKALAVYDAFERGAYQLVSAER
jgi:methyl acetate hydrolase